MAKRKGKKPRPRYQNRQATRIYIKKTPRGVPKKRPRCIITGKECFETEDDCWDWITKIGQLGVCAPYRCFDCTKIHMTSNETTVARRMREREAGSREGGIWSF